MTAASGTTRFDLTDRVVIVTGGGTGIGRVYSEALAEAGARVVIADIPGEAAEQIAARIRAAGGAPLAIRTDVSNEQDTDRMAAAAMNAYGRIDALTDNASLMSGLGDDNIAVNAVTPGYTESDSQVASSAPEYRAARREGRAFKRAQLPEDLVGTVMFLVADASEFITGQTIDVDGGEAMH